METEGQAALNILKRMVPIIPNEANSEACEGQCERRALGLNAYCCSNCIGERGHSPHCDAREFLRTLAAKKDATTTKVEVTCCGGDHYHRCLGDQCPLYNTARERITAGRPDFDNPTHYHFLNEVKRIVKEQKDR